MATKQNSPVPSTSEPSVTPPQFTFKLELWHLVFVLVGLAIVTRFLYLGYMTYHHDESIHAWYAYKIYSDYDSSNIFKSAPLPYRYDPVYHGPFLYHWGAIWFFFGNNDFIGRFGHALLGVVLVLMLWWLKDFIGVKATLMTMLFVTLSPIVCYFSRFARNDGFMATWAVIMLVCTMQYMIKRNSIWFIPAALSVFLMYATKENSYIQGFVYCSFLVGWALLLFIRKGREGFRLVFDTYHVLTKMVVGYGLFSVFSFFYVVLNVKTGPHKETNPDAMVGGFFTAHDKIFDIESWQAGVPLFVFTPRTLTWVLVALVLTIVSYTGMFFIRRAVRNTEPAQPEQEPQTPVSWKLRMTDWWVPWVILFVGGFLYVLLFTTMFLNPAGVRASMYNYVEYWFRHQAGEYRIPGLWWAYLIRMLNYETLSCILALMGCVYYLWRTITGMREVVIANIVGVFSLVFIFLFNGQGGLALLGADAVVIALPLVLVITLVPMLFHLMGWKWFPPLTCPYRLFMVWNVVLLVLLYAGLHEKVPWLMTPQSLPINMLAAIFAYDILVGSKPLFRAGFSGVLVLGCLLMFVNLCRFCYYYPDDAREVGVYTQSHRDVKDITREAERVARELPNTKTIINVDSDSEWPFVWYLRKLAKDERVRWKTVNANTPLQVTHKTQSNMQTMQRQGGGKYTVSEKILRNWWVPRIPVPAGQGRYEKFLRRFVSTPPVQDRKDWHGLLIPNLFAAMTSWEWHSKLFNYWLFRVGPRPPHGQPVSDRINYWAPPIGTYDMYFFQRDDVAPPGSTMIDRLADFAERATLVSQPQELRVFGSQGEGPGQFAEPQGIAVAPDGSVWVVDSKLCRVQKFAPDGTHLLTVGTAVQELNPPGQAAPLEFNSAYGGPTGIAVGSDGSVYVCDTWHYRIQKLNSDGEFVQEITGGTANRLYGPRDVAVSPDGTQIYVMDTGNGIIRVFSSDGEWVRNIGRKGGGAGEFNEPVGIGFGPDGNLYICDTGNYRVQVLTPQGRMLREWSVEAWSNAPSVVGIGSYLAVDTNGMVHLIDSISSVVHTFDQSGKRTATWGSGGWFSGPKGIAVDTENNLYISDTNNGRIKVYSSAQLPPTTESAAAEPAPEQPPQQITIDASEIEGIEGLEGIHFTIGD